MYRLGNFPPSINNITETSDTNALTGTDTVCVVVGETYMFHINVTDPNEEDQVSLSLNGTVPEGASIDQGMDVLDFISYVDQTGNDTNMPKLIH